MTLILLVGLAILSCLALIVGSAWAMALFRSKNHTHGGDERWVPNGEQINEEEELVYLNPAYARGAEPEGERQALNFSEMKRGLKRGHWQKTLPIFLAVFGFLGLLLFGSLALFMAMEDKLVGGLVAAVAIFTVVRIVIRMVQA